MPAATTDTTIVRGYRGIRELLGIDMHTVSAMVRFDAERQPPILGRVPGDRRATVRATSAEVWALFREFASAQAVQQNPPTTEENPAQER